MKKQSKACRVPTGKQPTRAEYNKLRRSHNAMVGRDSIRLTGLMADDDLPTPHLMPPYGAPCWQQAYREALAYKAAAEALAVARQKAAAYETAWDAMDECLNGLPV